MTSPPTRIGQSNFNTYWQCEKESDRDEYFPNSPGIPKIPVVNGDCILVVENAELFTWQNGKWHSLNN